MKILLLHTDYIKFKPLKKALKSIAELEEKEKEEKLVKEALVVMVAVEKSDSDIKKIVEKLAEQVIDVAKQVNAKKIVLYPYAHLSSNLASPDLATGVLNEAEKELKKTFEVAKAPFGYYKEFELKVKGHPLSELSREIKIEGAKEEEKYDVKHLLNEISKSRLDTSKLKDNDHRIIGQQMDLFSFSEVAPGMVFWHNNGLIIRNELINFWREPHRKAGYEEISRPQIMDKKLWQISGHWEKYKDNNLSTEYEKRKFLIKPMNCPGGMLVYKNRPKSYKDLPLRVGEMGIVHRVELSGVLAGLFRVIQFTQDDAHIFCEEKQIESEISRIMDLIDLFYKKFNLKFDHIELSTRPEKRIGAEEMWDKSEHILEKVLKEKKVKYKVNAGDGAFYGPKIDFHIKDSLGRTWQLSTIQLDFSMPERFDLEYTDKDNTRKRPVMLHRVIYGSLERFIGILLENTNGRMPLWLAPMQIRVLSFTDRNMDYAKKVVEKLEKEIPNLRIDSDFRQTTIPAKVKDAEIMRIPYTIVLGDKEEKDKSLAVRVSSKAELRASSANNVERKGNSKIETMKLDDFIKKVSDELRDRK